MDKFISVFILILGLSGSLALHIVMSPEEAEKIMKREDEFSKGLAGFVDEKLSANSKSLGSKDAKIDEIKRLLREKLGGLPKAKKDAASVEIKKSAPPALPLDTKKEDNMASLEQLVDKLVKEVDDKQKRSCATYKCWVNYGREVEHANEAESGNEVVNVNEAKKSPSEDSLERIYQSVKRLVDSEKKKSVTGGQRSQNIVSDSGDVGDRMLARVKDMIKKKSQGIKPEIFEDPSAKSAPETRSDLEAKVDKLLHKVSQLTKKDEEKDAGDLALDAVKELVAKKKDASKVTEVKGEKTKSNLEAKTGSNKVPIDLSKLSRKELMDYLAAKFTKYVFVDKLFTPEEFLAKLHKFVKELKSGTTEVPPHIDLAVGDAAIEKYAKRASSPKNDDKRREIIKELLKTYDEMTRRKDAKRSDVYANELENASKTLKRSSGTEAELIKGFEQRDEEEKIHKSHPK